ncbi:ADP-ribose glycohydrolase MACROD1-like [Homarus americanus]|uniref:ADP-ribose glycohydrolase MACROD1-like n=2 Tax=Homarus americanus TaxID=6706 RepID=A0A8J5N9S2_HOMAM|nr:ADP-ribose glycohydrolase MACROD1-like [Homarus americanus]
MTLFITCPYYILSRPLVRAPYSSIKVFCAASESLSTNHSLPLSSHNSCSTARGVSRSATLTMWNFEEDKRKILSMKVEDKRKRYRCGNVFVTLRDLPNWPNYGRENSYVLKQVALNDAAVAKVLEGSIYKVDSDLNKKISLFIGDITTLEIDAVVNAANNSLRGGGGVDGAIHKAAGGMLYQECQSLNGCDTGDAKITGGYYLPARYIIHTVGPTGEKPAMLESCYRRALQTAIENNIRTVAFPCISTGVYGYPNESAVKVVLPIIRTMLEANRDKFDRIIFCLFLSVDINLYHKLLPVFFPLQ